MFTVIHTQQRGIVMSEKRFSVMITEGTLIAAKTHCAAMSISIKDFVEHLIWKELERIKKLKEKKA